MYVFALSRLWSKKHSGLPAIDKQPVALGRENFASRRDWRRSPEYLRKLCILSVLRWNSNRQRSHLILNFFLITWQTNNLLEEPKQNLLAWNLHRCQVFSTAFVIFTGASFYHQQALQEKTNRRYNGILKVCCCFSDLQNRNSVGYWMLPETVWQQDFRMGCSDSKSAAQSTKQPQDKKEENQKPAGQRIILFFSLCFLEIYF